MRQFVVIETLTVGFSELLEVVGLAVGFAVFGAGEDVADAITGVAVSEGVIEGVSVTSSVLV